MNNENSILFSQGLRISNINGDIDKTAYKAVYTGNTGKMLITNKDKSYYIEADENDMANLFNQPTSNDNLSKKLTKLMAKPKNKTKKVRITNPLKKQRMRYTVKKYKKAKKNKKVKKNKKAKKAKKTSKRKKRQSVKNKLQNLLSGDLLKTII